MLLSLNQLLTRVISSAYWAFNLALQVTKAEVLHIFTFLSKHHKITSPLLTKCKLLLAPNLSWRERHGEAETSYLLASYIASGDEKGVGA